MLAGVEAVVEMVSVEAPDPPSASETLGALKDAVGPFVTTGETEAVRPTEPEKPRLLRLIVTMAEEPA